MEDARRNQAFWALRITFGVIPIVAGLDKFTNLLTHWEQYLNPLVTRLLPFSGSTFMRIVGLVEVVVGFLVLTRWTRVGAYLASAWLALIALNLITAGHYLDVAARDATMAVAAFALARLEEARVGVPARRPALATTSPARV
jgi:uncharacterized membrane protein YphA (DoxX/SURF4 family)